MKKYRITENGDPDFTFYFDNDCFTEAGGDYCYNLFIIDNDGWGRLSGFNIDAYKDAKNKAEDILDAFENIGPRAWYPSHKAAMLDFDIKYTSARCHALKEWAKNADTDKTEDMAAFLSIITGHPWDVIAARGYSQGDYDEVVFCPDFYEEKDAKAAGEIYLGAAKEFIVSELDEDGEEIDSCGGYIVADCQAWKDEEYKKLVCEWAGIPEEETELRMIDGYKTVTHYTYRTA